MTFGARRRQRRLQQTQDWARCLVRSGLLAEQEIQSEVMGVIAQDHPDIRDPEAIAAEWIADARSAWAAEAALWVRPTDYDQLESALGELRARGYLVLQGCADHWAARDALVEAPTARGVLWFVPADVWHAIDEPMLEINLWHPSTANAAEGDAITGEVLSVVNSQGLEAVFDEGRIEVSARWQCLPGG